MSSYRGRFDQKVSFGDALKPDVKSSLEALKLNLKSNHSKSAGPKGFVVKIKGPSSRSATGVTSRQNACSQAQGSSTPDHTCPRCGHKFK